MDQLKVSSKSNPNSVAGALVAAINENDKVEIQIIGAGALNQAMKAIVIARGFIAPMGTDLICKPAFTTVEIEGETKTGMKLIIKEEK